MACGRHEACFAPGFGGAIGAMCGAMMRFARLPPVGNLIRLRHEDATTLPALADCTTVWLDSGTASLAVAIASSRILRPEILNPEVVLPGYGCPDLVAAALFANVTPVIADIQASDPGYDLNSLKAAINKNTVAVVAVNFLGIKDRLQKIQEDLTRSGGPALIEDNAQWFPEPFNSEAMQGDYMCLSFGRGKPVSLLGGGACIVRNHLIDALGEQLRLPRVSRRDKWVKAKILAYNALLNRNAYGIVSRLPFLGLGETALHVLERIDAMDSNRKHLLQSNVHAYQHRSRANEEKIHRIVNRFPGLIDMPIDAGGRSGRLLRYPLLFESKELCGRVYRRLEHQGLGASLMYRRALPDIPGVAARCIVPSELVNASAFAERLLTLPTHQGVRSSDLERLSVVLEQELAR